MPRRISEVLGLDHETLRDVGVFDGFVDIDSKFYADPQLVRIANTEELERAYSEIEQHFTEILALINASQEENDRFWKEAKRRLTFPEPNYIALGYSVDSPAGSGIGSGLAQRLVEAASDIIAVGIEDPAIFELVGLFEKQFGADRISDMIIQIIWSDIADYTERVADSLRVPTTDITVGGGIRTFPYDREAEKPLLLVPSEILTPLPVAESWSDVDVVARHNEQLRARVNQLVGDTWLRMTREMDKDDLKATLLRNPELLRDLIDNYRSKTPEPYDFDIDPVGELAWYDAAQQYTSDYPLPLSAYQPVTGESLLNVVRIICNQFKRLVEDNQLARMLYQPDGSRRHERIAQLLFFGIADSYCEANNLDLSREPNAGRGPVDFKIGRGYEAKVNVEVKLTSNSHWRSGYEDQLPTYNEAERTLHSIYLVIINTETTAATDTLPRLRDEAQAEGRRAPELVFVDGRVRPTASKI